LKKNLLLGVEKKRNKMAEKPRRLCTHNRYSKGREMDVKEMFLRRGFSTVEVRLIDGDSAYEVYVTGQSLTLQIDNLENERVAVLLKNKDKEIVGTINQRYDEFKNALKARDEEYLVWSRTDAKYKSSETKMD
jgi:small nuclear ribonucleoprotein (snRNP)-like protein